MGIIGTFIEARAMLVKEKPKTVRRVRHYFTFTPKCIEDLELAAFTHRRTTGEKTRVSHIIEKLVETEAIAVGVEAFKFNREELEKKALDKWGGTTLHGQYKQQYGAMLQPEIFRTLLKESQEMKGSISELIEWTVREGGLTVMNKRLNQ